MSKTFAKSFILGHASDIEFNVSNSGVAYARFTVDTSTRQKDASTGELAEVVHHHNVVAFEKRAEIIKERLKKGDLCIIQGRFETTTWTDRATGEKRFKTETVVEDISFVGSADKVPVWKPPAMDVPQEIPSIDSVW
jgi:single-strand DNA-binding protein